MCIHRFCFLVQKCFGIDVHFSVFRITIQHISYSNHYLLSAIIIFIDFDPTSIVHFHLFYFISQYILYSNLELLPITILISLQQFLLIFNFIMSYFPGQTFILPIVQLAYTEIQLFVLDQMKNY